MVIYVMVIYESHMLQSFVNNQKPTFISAYRDVLTENKFAGP